MPVIADADLKNDYLNACANIGKLYNAVRSGKVKHKELINIHLFLKKFSRLYFQRCAELIFLSVSTVIFVLPDSIRDMLAFSKLH
jgi:hypothetical protein